MWDYNMVLHVDSGMLLVNEQNANQKSYCLEKTRRGYDIKAKNND